MYLEISGDLFEVLQTGHFDVIGHQTNCFNTQGAGISGMFCYLFNTDKFKSESFNLQGDINKLGNIDYENKIAIMLKGAANQLTYVDEMMANTIDFTSENVAEIVEKRFKFSVVNIYGQYKPGANTDYHALRLCFKKINHIFKGKKILLPQIGAGIGGGSWHIISNIIERELIDCDVTVVIYNKNLKK